ncbi:leucine-rich repeat flightless-interacting protein 2 isoform X46 [Siphateles boraxobius]|uniref:leucine-rich repeat flightless-interacting protein 2 isoform X46 n=1 Tax=Siphateles boraxobius TaxID=180520 RepID=UPI004063F13B
MGSQGPGRKRTPSKNGLTAEEDALNVIAKEAEARLAAKRAARAEAREIRMRELERQQKEVSDDEERMSVGSKSNLRLDLDAAGAYVGVDDRSERDLEKGSSRASTISGATLTSLGGTSSRRGSGDTSISADTEASIREIKDSLLEVEEKYRKAMVSNAQLDNEKTNMMYEVDTLKDSLMELEEMLFETRRELEEKTKDLEREKHAHSILQFQFSELKETLKQSEELLTKHGIVLGPDLATNGETGEEAEQNFQTASTEIREGSSVLEIRLRKLVDERENLIEQVKRLKGQFEQKKQNNGMEDASSPEGDVLENGADSNIVDIQRDANRQVNDLKFKLVKSEQEVTALEQNVTRLEGQVTRYKAASENSEKVEDELKAEKRKLQRELRSALDKIEELESSNTHLSKRLEKMKTGRGTAATP